MSLAFVKKAATRGTTARAVLQPETGLVIGENMHRIHAWEVEAPSAGGEPFLLDVSALDDVDFGDDKWTPAPGTASHQLWANNIFKNYIDKWWGQYTVWRVTTVGDLKKALTEGGNPKRYDLWVLDASTPSLIVWDANAEEQVAYDVGVGDPQEVPDDEDAMQFYVDGKYLFEALRGPADQLIYLGWAKDVMTVPLAVVYEDEPFWAMIMGMRP